MKKNICFLCLLLLILPLEVNAQSTGSIIKNLMTSGGQQQILSIKEGSPLFQSATPSEVSALSTENSEESNENQDSDAYELSLAEINTKFDLQNHFSSDDPKAQIDPPQAQVLSDDTIASQLSSIHQGSIPIPADTLTFGTRGNEKLMDATALSDGGFLLVGYADVADSSTKSQAAWAIRFSETGEKSWEFTYQNKESIGYFGMAKENPDGTILLYYVNNLFNLRTHSLLTISADGELISDSPMSSRVYKVYQTKGGIIVDSGVGLTKYDDQLTIQYELEDAMLQHIEFSTEDGLLFYGYFLRDQSLLGDAVAFMINESGDILWNLEVQQNARFEGCTKLPNGDYLCTGYMENEAGRESGIAARIQPDGTLRYFHEYSLSGEYFFLTHAYPLQNGALLVGGSNAKNWIYLIQVDEDGNEVQRYVIDLGKRFELTSTPIRIIAGDQQLFIVGDLVYCRSLLELEDTDIFVITLDLPITNE